MSKFQVGDRVVRTKGSHYGMFVGDEGTVTEVNDGSHSFSVSVKMDKNGDIAPSCNAENLKLLSSVSNIKNALTGKPIMQNLVTTFKSLFVAEPQKTFQKAGIVDTNGDLTPDGTKVFLAWMLQTNGVAFKTAVADQIVAEQEANK